MDLAEARRRYREACASGDQHAIVAGHNTLMDAILRARRQGAAILVEGWTIYAPAGAEQPYTLRKHYGVGHTAVFASAVVEAPSLEAARALLPPGRGLRRVVRQTRADHPSIVETWAPPLVLEYLARRRSL